MSDRLAKKILLVGWDAAEWNVIRPMMNQGKLPYLTRLIDGGISGNLRSLHPHHSPMVWTSIATGKRPHQHGISGYSEVCPNGMDTRAITSYARRTKALWNMLSQSGMRAHCVNWYASDPAEPINGVYISRAFFSPQESAGTDRNSTPLVHGKYVHPPQLEDELSQLRIGAEELDPASIMELLPAGTGMDILNHPRMRRCADVLAETASVHAVACEIVQNHPFDLMAVLYTGLERFSHLLMPFQPPRQSHITEREFAIYQQALSVAYQLHDMMLGRLIELAGDDATIIVVSDHGFKTGVARCDQRPVEGIEAAVALHDSQGILVMQGQHIVRDDTIEGTTVLDVAPTILSLLGLPVATDMDGRPMLGAIDEAVAASTISGWDQIQSEQWGRPAEPVTQVDEQVRYLIDLGYKESATSEARHRIDQTRCENTYNLARALIDARQTDRAIPLLELLSKQAPYRADLNKTLFEAYNEVGRSSEARAIVQHFWDTGERGPLVHLGFALVSLTERKPAEALAHLNQIANCDLIIPGLHVLVGQAYLRLREWDLAEKAFTAELSLNNNNEVAWGGLAVSAAGKQHYQAAAEHALLAVGLKPDYAAAHYQLGQSLYHLGRYLNAAQAFKRCLEIDPGFAAASRGLTGLYEGPLADPEKALASRHHAAAWKKHRHAGRVPMRSARIAPVSASSMSYV